MHSGASGCGTEIHSGCFEKDTGGRRVKKQDDSFDKLQSWIEDLIRTVYEERRRIRHANEEISRSLEAEETLSAGEEQKKSGITEKDGAAFRDD